MPRISPVDPRAAQGRAPELLEGVQKHLGMTPNMMKTMAQSPVVLEGYLALNQALAHGALPPKLREQIAIAVAQINGCDYCLSAHTLLGKGAGLKLEELTAARRQQSSDPKSEAGLRFAAEIVAARGRVPDESLAAVRAAGYTDGEIAEIVAHVGINVFTNYFNLVAGTDVDFPPVYSAQAA